MEANETSAGSLAHPVELLEGVGPKRAEQLRQLGVASVGDLLAHFPARYEDRTSLLPFALVEVGQVATVRGAVTKSRNVRLRGKQTLAEVWLSDGDDELKAVFFGRGFLASSVFRPGVEVVLTGQVKTGEPPVLDNPEYEVLETGESVGLNTGRIVPVYPLAEGISQRQMRRWIAQALQLPSYIPTPVVPAALRKRRGLLATDTAVQVIHFPERPEQAAAARKSIAYEELLLLQVSILLERRANDDAGGLTHVLNGPLLRKLHGLLPFTLTEEQDRTIADVVQDMASSRPMRRLVQGDVGSGKTMVALHAIAMAADTGCQSALMAPTEILATQHYLHLNHLLSPLGLRVALLSGGVKDSAAVRAGLADGSIHVAVGTHALFQKATDFHRLGLVIIDEQHRFGVMQRQTLTEKAHAAGVVPDLLQLTATPIPRTLALTAYGHLDVSVIRTLPPGRQPIRTLHVVPRRIPEMFEALRREIGVGRQAYIVCPLIDDSDLRQAKAAVSHHEALCCGPLAGLRVGLLHGRMSAEEKASIMEEFKAAALDVLVCTTVIEVGVDVPNATVLIIEDAHSFSLPQLHQLRGRIGRGQHPSTCFLTGASKTDSGKQRVALLCECSDGFEISEADLALRGPGAFYGVRQSGLSDLRAASLISDARLIEDAREDARALLAKDPMLTTRMHAGLKQAILRRLGDRTFGT